MSMKKSHFTEEQIAYAQRQAETGTAVTEVCRAMGVSERTYYSWKKQFGGLGVQEIRRLKPLEEENRKLKQLVADLSLDKLMPQDMLAETMCGLSVDSSWSGIWNGLTGSASAEDARSVEMKPRQTVQ